MSEAVAVRKSQDIVREGYFDLSPRSMSEALQLAELMAKSTLVPTQYRDKPGDVLIAVQYGAEVGLKPLQALQGIAVINGRPTLWGDAALAVVLASGLVENYKEMSMEDIETSGKAVAWFKRRGTAEPIVREFSIENAKKARLWGKQGPWTEYPYRMLQMRARAWAMRDGFSDALKGISIREEVIDIEASPAPQVLAMPRRKSAAPVPEPVHNEPEPTHSEPVSDSIKPKCERCGGECKLVPAGTSKKTGKPYGAFWACESAACKVDGKAWTIRDSDWQAKLDAQPEPLFDGREPGSEG